jgi:histone H1/5
VNPAFDVTPARLITAIVTEAGVATPPFGAALKRMVNGSGRPSARAIPKKPPLKRPPAKKPPAKKPLAKKPLGKKPLGKKAVAKKAATRKTPAKRPARRGRKR